jgi:hypothetical protein
MQATQFKVSEKLTLVSTEVEDGETRSTHYSCNVRASIAGDSIWDCEITDADDVRITNIYINEGVDGGDMDGYRHIAVVYTVNVEEEVEGSWRLYTDNGFEATVSELLGEEITFTEQGMQDDNYASME